jgi:Phasin protein
MGFHIVRRRCSAPFLVGWFGNSVAYVLVATASLPRHGNSSKLKGISVHRIRKHSLIIDLAVPIYGASRVWLSCVRNQPKLLWQSDGQNKRERFRRADYSKRSFENGTKTMENLFGAKSLDKAFEVQSEYAKSAYEDYVSCATKLGALYTDLAKEAFKPYQGLVAKATPVE